MKTIALIMVIPLMVSCGPDPDMPLHKQTAEAAPVAVKENSRITVTRIGVFSDDLAYGDKRGVYIIRDAKTGKEYIGISGIGVSETACHYVSTGKSGYCQSDER